MPLDVTRTGDEITVRLLPDADGTFAWIDGLHHDWEGAMRAFRYLGQKAVASYDAADPKAQKVADTVERHLQSLARVKEALIDKVVPLDR